eukprot:7260595-Lingulodinium_polyedra.AAC.1
MARWRPTALAAPRAGTLRFFSQDEQAWYYWDPQSRQSTWALPDELRAGGHGNKVRVLVLVAGEGSQGWALLQFLANHERLR